MKETDREVILLRYFENRPFSEIGVRCGLNENAARMRVERALEKLRGLLGKRGMTTVTALATVISAHAVEVAPAGLAATLATTSVAYAGAGTFALWNIMNMTKLRFALGTVVVLGASTAAIVQHQARARLFAANESLTQQIGQLKADNQTLSNLVAQAKKSASLPNDQFNELLRLRGKAGMFRQQTDEMARLQRENQKLLSQVAAPSEPTDQLSAEDQFALRQKHASEAMTTLLQAIKNYAANHNGQYPGNFGQLTASGELGVSNFAGHLGLNDFQFMKDGVEAVQSNKVILGLKTPIQRPGSPSVMVLGGIDDSGVPHTYILNWGLPDAAQTSPVPNP